MGLKRYSDGKEGEGRKQRRMQGRKNGHRKESKTKWRMVCTSGLVWPTLELPDGFHEKICPSDGVPFGDTLLHAPPSPSSFHSNITVCQVPNDRQLHIKSFSNTKCLCYNF